MNTLHFSAPLKAAPQKGFRGKSVRKVKSPLRDFRSREVINTGDAVRKPVECSDRRTFKND